jgi:transposase
MHKYPSDISRNRFEIIRADLEGAKKTTRPRRTDLYDVFCAVLYLLKSGCSWRSIPSDFPDKSLVRYYYDIWAAKGEDGSTLLSEVLKKISTQIPEERRPER